MDEKQAHFDWGFGLQWLVVVAIGVAAAGIFAFASIWSVGDVVEDTLGETAAVFIIGGLFGAIFALGAGLGSGLLMKKQGLSAGRWIIVTVAAGAIGMAIGFTLVFTFLDVDTMPEVLAGLMIGLSLGLPIGIGQSVLLRKHHFRANEWTVINTLAFTLAMVVALPLGGEGREWISLGAMGLVYGAVTGLGMVWLLARQTAMQPISAT